MYRDGEYFLLRGPSKQRMNETNCINAEFSEADCNFLLEVNNIYVTSINHKWLTEHGNLVMLNNGIEFAATYFIMLSTLFFIGSGKYASVDYWVSQKIAK